MKQLIKYTISFLMLVIVSSCDKQLKDLNENKVNPTTLEPSLLFNQAIGNSNFPFKTLVFDICIVQQMISPKNGVIAGANFNQDSRDVTTLPIWQRLSRIKAQSIPATQ
jgi:hypothetical protein